jgi:hypothetical protein
MRQGESKDLRLSLANLKFAALAAHAQIRDTSYTGEQLSKCEAAMRKSAVVMCAFLAAFSVPLLHADLAAIHANALPQETAVLAALDDARQLEPYSRSFTADPQWNFPLAKSEVAARLGKDLGFLQLAAKNHPDNAELLLLTGLVAHYAYNVDVEGSFETAMNMLDQAHKLASADVRPSWFRAMLQCQTMHPDTGANEFLSIETGHAWDQLPAAFWGDYMECAAITNMPAHALRAASHIEKLHGPQSQMTAFLVGAEKKRFEPYDPAKKYQPKEVWEGEKAGDEVIFTSTMCGVRLHAHGDWGVENLELGNGSCVANFSAGPYKGTAHDLHPSVLLLVQRPKEGESLEEYSMKFQKDGTFEPDPALHCPVAHCIALMGVQPGMYKRDGDGHGRLVIFERDEPEFPGLIFESPQGPPQPKAGAGPVAYHPNQIQQRIPGKLYYVVLLDAAASIEEPALKDYDFFLQNLTVE